MTINLTPAQRQALIDNDLVMARNPEHDPVPIVHLFQSYGPAKWLLVSMAAHEAHLAWGIADLGLGYVEEGLIDLREIATLRVERDNWWSPKARFSAYLNDSARTGRLNTALVDPAVVAALKAESATAAAAFQMTVRAEAAYAELLALGAPVYDHSGDLGTQFKIGGELRDAKDVYFADYYGEEFHTDNGVREDVQAILDRHGLEVTWLDPGTCGVFDPAA